MADWIIARLYSHPCSIERRPNNYRSANSNSPMFESVVIVIQLVYRSKSRATGSENLAGGHKKSRAQHAVVWQFICYVTDNNQRWKFVVLRMALKKKHSSMSNKPFSVLSQLSCPFLQFTNKSFNWILRNRSLPKFVFIVVWIVIWCDICEQSKANHNKRCP